MRWIQKFLFGVIGLQYPVIPLSLIEGIIDFHHNLTFFLIILSVVVCWLLIKCILINFLGEKEEEKSLVITNLTFLSFLFYFLIFIMNLSTVYCDDNGINEIIEIISIVNDDNVMSINENFNNFFVENANGFRYEDSLSYFRTPYGQISSFHNINYEELREMHNDLFVISDAILENNIILENSGGIIIYQNSFDGYSLNDLLHQDKTNALIEYITNSYSSIRPLPSNSWVNVDGNYILVAGLKNYLTTSIDFIYFYSDTPGFINNPDSFTRHLLSNSLYINQDFSDWTVHSPRNIHEVVIYDGSAPNILDSPTNRANDDNVQNIRNILNDPTNLYNESLRNFQNRIRNANNEDVQNIRNILNRVRRIRSDSDSD